MFGHDKKMFLGPRQEHVSEYGTSWNFFLSLAVLQLVTPYLTDPPSRIVPNTREPLVSRSLLSGLVLLAGNLITPLDSISFYESVHHLNSLYMQFDFFFDLLLCTICLRES